MRSRNTHADVGPGEYRETCRTLLNRPSEHDLGGALPPSGDFSYLHLHKQSEAATTARYEGVTMFKRIVLASVLIHDLLRYAPTNVVLAWLRRRDRLKFGIPFMLLGAAYWTTTMLRAAEIQSGAPD